MGSTWVRIRSGWNRTDTWVSVANVLALLLFVADGWCQSVAICYVASVVPLSILAWRAFRDAPLRHALAFGGLVAWLWPVVEGSYVHTLGWWGSYLAKGPCVWDTPVYCILVGWLTASYVAYGGLRVIEMGFARSTAAWVTGGTALILSVAGENLLVRAGMWTYESWGWHLGYVPVYVSLGYGVAYFALPWLHGMRAPRAAFTFTAFTLVLFFGIGFAANVFAR